MKRTTAPILSPQQHRELLLAKRAALLAEFGIECPRLPELGRVAEDDQAPILHEQFISRCVQMLDYQTLHQIEAALERLAAGDYGVCLACGEAISPKRLTAIPWAEYCISCQERLGSMTDGGKVDERAA